MTDIRPRIEGPLDWRGAQMRQCADWLVTFDTTERAELERATAGVRHKPIAEIERVDFPLPTLAPKLDRARHEIIEGRVSTTQTNAATSHQTLYLSILTLRRTSLDYSVCARRYRGAQAVS
ncbi:MAG: hypothetical protein ACPGQI_06595 [Gammaproteobacteria bacterium]